MKEMHVVDDGGGDDAIACSLTDTIVWLYLHVYQLALYSLIALGCS